MTGSKVKTVETRATSEGPSVQSESEAGGCATKLAVNDRAAGSLEEADSSDYHGQKPDFQQPRVFFFSGTQKNSHGRATPIHRTGPTRGDRTTLP